MCLTLVKETYANRVYPRTRRRILLPFSLSPRVKGINDANLIHHFHAFDALSASSVIFHLFSAAAKEKKSPLLMTRKIEYFPVTNLKGCRLFCPLLNWIKEQEAYDRSPSRCFCIPPPISDLVSTALYAYCEAVHVSLLALYQVRREGCTKIDR